MEKGGCVTMKARERRSIKRYLVQRRTDSINPAQLKPWQLVLPVSIKDGLKTQKSQNAFTPGFVLTLEKQKRQVFLQTIRLRARLTAPKVLLWSKEKSPSALKTNRLYFPSIFYSTSFLCSLNLRGSTEAVLQRQLLGYDLEVNI